MSVPVKYFPLHLPQKNCGPEDGPHPEQMLGASCLPGLCGNEKHKPTRLSATLQTLKKPSNHSNRGESVEGEATVAFSSREGLIANDN